MNTKFSRIFRLAILATGLTGLVFSLPASAHIDLLTPTPLLDGKAMNFKALKNQPFGAPGVDVAAAPATDVQAGSVIEIEVEVYVFHPGEIVVLYTRDLSGQDVAPALELAAEGDDIPHYNLLYKGRTPGPGEGNRFRASVQLPDIEGEIILVVRQVMHDKIDVLDDGRVSLKRVYYHQAAKLNLVK